MMRRTTRSVIPTILRVLILGLLGGLISIIFQYIEKSKPSTAEILNVAPRRIITLSPAVTEIVFALGLGEYVVAASDFANYPPEVNTKERVGGYFNPNLEKILALRTDCVITQGSHPKLVNFCNQYDIKLTQVALDGIDSLYQTLTLLGRILDCRKQAVQLKYSIENKLNAIKEKVGERDRIKTFFCFNRRQGELHSLYTISSEGFLGELLDSVGGENIYTNLTSMYQKISRESLIRAAPEVIIEVQNNRAMSIDQRQKLINDWQQLSIIPAVKNDRIYILTDDYILLPGPRIPRIAARLAEVIHRDFDE